VQDGSVVRLPDGSTWRAPSLASADRERVRFYGFPAFAPMALPHIPGMPAKPLWNWHFEELALHAQALFDGKCSVINETMPPNMGKSSINIVLFVPFMWTQDPSIQVMTATYGDKLARQFAQQTLDMLQGRWFVERWGHLLQERKGAKPNILELRTKKGGHRIAVTAPAGQGTGLHGDYFLLDDLITAFNAQKPGHLAKVSDWIASSVVTRGRMVGVQKILSGMQRLSLNDPADALRTAFTGMSDYVELMLPYRFEPERRCVTPFGGDRRRVEGELLWDVKFARDGATKIERMSGGPTSQQARAQLQQDPTSGDDAIFDAKFFKRFTIEEMPIGRCVATAISVDPTFTNGKTGKRRKAGDFVAMEVWGVYMNDDGLVSFYCYHSEEVRRGFHETVAAIVALRQAWRPVYVLVELAAAGHQIVEELERIGVTGVTGIVVQGTGSADNPIGKVQKAKVVSAYFKAGLVHFLEGAPWYERKARNLIRFPNGPHDDDVDTTSQALQWLMHEFGFSGGWLTAVGGYEDELKELDAAGSRGIIDTDGGSLPLLLG